MRHALLLVALLAARAQGQIIYTDVIPDEEHIATAINDTCWIDLDNDGSMDFQVMCLRDSTGPDCAGPCLPGSHTRPTHVYADPLNGNDIADSAIAYPAELWQGEPIDASLAWNTSASQLLIEYVGASCQHVGNFNFCFPTIAHGDWEINSNGYTTGFLGLRFFIGADRHYGWARFRIDRNGTGITSYTLQDHAYNGVPDGPIGAGDTLSLSTGTALGTPAAPVLLFPNPFTGSATLALGAPLTSPCWLTILDLTGRELRRTRLVEKRTLLHQDGLAPGAYMYTLDGSAKGKGRMVIE